MNQESFYEKQKNGQWKTLTNSLKNNPEIKSHLNKFITTFYWKFREKKGIKETHPQVKFQGFAGFEDFSEEGKMGHCEAPDLTNHWQTVNDKKVEGSEYWTGNISIVLNQRLLLDKLGMDKCFSSERNYLEVGFEELIGTIAHELAHAHQFITNLGKGEEISQCESTGKRDANGNLLFPELVAEHTRFTNEIKNLIESSSEYQEFKKWWKTGQGQKVQSQTNNLNDKSKKLDDLNENNATTKCRECQKGIARGEKMYYDFDGNKYCERCGKGKQEKISQTKCPGCGIELGKLSDNHDTATCFQINNELKLKKQFEKNMDKFRKTQKDLREFQTRSCPGGCGRKVKENEICSYEDCIQQRNYRILDESGDTNFIRCSECGALHRGQKSLEKYCANCQKTTSWNAVELKFDREGEYQIIPKKSSFSNGTILIVGGIALLVLLVIGFFWLIKRRFERNDN